MLEIWGISYMCKIRLSSVEAKSREGHTYGTEKGSDGEEIIESGLQVTTKRMDASKVMDKTCLTPPGPWL